MSEATNETATPPVGEATPNADAAPVKAKPAKVRKALALLKRHPLGLVVAAGAAVALVEIELAVGILTGIGATALLATKSGPDARQEVFTKGQEVLTKSKAAIERARVALASRAKTNGAEAPAAETAAPASAASAPAVSATEVSDSTATTPAAPPSEATTTRKAEEPPPTAAT